MMTTTILTILFASSFAFVFIEVLRLPEYHDPHFNIKPLNFKPLNCITCLSGWVGLITAFVAGFGLFSIMFLPICMVAGIALEGLLKRL